MLYDYVFLYILKVYCNYSSIVDVYCLDEPCFVIEENFLFDKSIFL